jgi:hypothetical protein
MKKTALIFLCSLLTALPALAYLGQVVASFRAPANYPLALARANSNAYMWVFCNSTPYHIYRINSETGSVYDSWISRLGSGTRGLAFSYGGDPVGNYLWMGNANTDRVHMCNYVNGSTYRSWSAGHDPFGLAPQAMADGGYNPQSIITTDTSPRYAWYHNPTTGSIISSHALSATVYDVAWDWRNALIWGGAPGAGVAYGWNTSGSLMATFRTPDPYPYAFTYNAYYLWVGCTLPNHHIYKIHCPVGVAVAPSSLGKVKAVFR